MQKEIKKRDPYWLSHDCIDCVDAYEAKMGRMRSQVRSNAQKLRDEFGLPEPGRGMRNRNAHMDVGR